MLMKHPNNRIQILSSRGQGQLNIIIRSDITLADAVQAAIMLKKELKLSKSEFTLDCDADEKGDYSIIQIQTYAYPQ